MQDNLPMGYDNMDKFEPVGYEHGTDLNNIPNDKPDDLYQDMLKPLDFQKPGPVIPLPKDDEERKKFAEEVMKKVEEYNNMTQGFNKKREEKLKKAADELNSRINEYKRMTEVFDKELEETRKKFIAEITGKEYTNEPSVKNTAVHSDRHDLDNDMHTPLLGDDTKNTGE